MLAVPEYGPAAGSWSGELVLLRHAQTDCTVAGTFCGEHDPPLSPAGRLMADQLADAAGLAGLDRLVVSPARRSVQTAAPLAGRYGLVARLEPRLRELRFGQWEGRRPEQVHTEPDYRRWCRDPARHPPPGGETGLAVLARVLAVATEAMAGRDGTKVALLTHKAPVRLLVCHFLGLPPADYRRVGPVAVCSVTRIAFDGGRPRLVELGGVEHLAPHWQAAPDQAG
ncbi:histidine phosphatase family protein [Jatrophihabitans sp.]|uniref:histidine phosphatase family protein n=1 Tax=Jatrophihabitans sp. TaxID=1932789 RepID=UPI002B951D8B|nr:histidine phosphatase family protein [Jatrophihabitans sp.]